MPKNKKTGRARRPKKTVPHAPRAEEGGLRPSGIDLIGGMKWGTHFCQFYETPQDLLDILVPYFKAGLEGNEFCMWVTSSPLGKDEARRALAAAVPDLDGRITSGQMEILDYRQWYKVDGRFDEGRVLDGWVRKLELALARGYEGLRLTGNTFWLEQADWEDFKQYEDNVNSVIGNYRMLAICTYSLEKCGAPEIMDVIANHQFAMVKRSGRWALIEGSERRKAAEAAKDSQRMLETVIEHLPAAVNLIRGSDQRLILFNPAYQAIAPGKAMVGKTLEELWPETGRDFSALCRGVLETGKPYHMDDDRVMIRRSPHGPLEEAFFSWSLDRVRLPGQEGWAILNTAYETTQRKRIEAAIRESERRFKALTETSPVAIGVGAPDGKILYVNKQYEEMLGYSKEELLGMAAPDLYMDSRDRLRWMDTLRRNGSVRDAEVRLKRKDGTPFWALLSIAPLDFAGTEAVIGTFSDISARKNAEEALAETRNYLENLIDHANAPIIVWSTDLCITRFNRAFENLSGYGAAEVLGRRLEMLFPQEGKSESLGKIERTATGELWESIEIPIRRKDGSARIVLWNSANITDKDGKTIISTIAQGQDITERKRAEQALAETSDYLESLIHHANAPIIVWSPNLCITRFNHAFEMLSGYDAGEVLGKSLEMLFPDRSKEESLDKIARTATGEHWESIEIPIMRKDGTIRIALWNSANIKDSKGQAIISTIAQGQDITERKNMEEAIRTSEAEMRGILDATKESIWLFDAGGIVLLANTVAVARIGRPAREIIGKRMDEIISPELARARTERLHEVVITGRPVEFEDERAMMHFHHTFYPVKDASGAVSAVVSFSRDITQQKRDEERIRHLASFPELNPNIILELDPSGRVVYANPFARRIVKEAGLGSVEGLLPGDMAGVLAELSGRPGGTALRETAAGERVFQTSIFHVQVMDRFRLYGADITGRKRAERELAESEQRFRAIASSTPDHILVQDRNLRYLMVINPQIGLTEQDMIGKQDSDFLTKEDAEKLMTLKRRVLETGKPQPFESSLVNRKGELEYFSGTYVPRYGADGKPDGIIGYFQNITERRKVEEALQKARERNAQQEKLAAVGRLAGGVAHELRNPLAAMKNATYYLGMAIENPDPSVSEAISVVNREINRSDTIITSLLGLVRPARALQAEVDVSAVLRETLGALRPPAGVAVETSLDESLPAVVADPGQLSVVFGNIVRNAFDAMPAGGRLTVRSGLEGKWVVVAVADSGAGMPREVVDRLFEPFMTTKEGGTGLGLSVAKMLVDVSGGRIEARSEEGKGTVFTVSLPVKA